MPTPSLYVTRRIFPEAIALLRSVAEVRQWESDLPPPYERLLAEAKESEALFTLLTDRIDAPLLAAAPRLRVVSNMAVGYNNVDVAAATSRGIYIGNTPGVLTETTAEFAFALLLAWARRVPEAQRFAREGKWKTWEPMGLLGVDLHGATLGIIGMGASARRWREGRGPFRCASSTTAERGNRRWSGSWGSSMPTSTPCLQRATSSACMCR